MVARRFFVTLLAASALAAGLAGCFAPSATDAISVVGNVRVEQDPKGARVTWTEEPVGRADGFIVYRDGRILQNVTAPARSFLDETVQPDVTVRYSVQPYDDDGTRGRRSSSVEFRYRQSLTLVADEDRWVNRGYANLSLAEVTPGIRWDGIVVTVNGKTLLRNDAAYRDHREAWTHSDARDALADLGERLQLFSPTEVVRNATLEVKLSNGDVLAKVQLAGRPTFNLTMRQERNVTAGLVSFVVVGSKLLDENRDVTASWPGVTPRWSALEVLVNGTRVPYAADGRLGSWGHDVPSDDVLRSGTRATLRLAPNALTPGAVVIVRDAEANEESYRHTLT